MKKCVRLLLLMLCVSIVGINDVNAIEGEDSIWTTDKTGGGRGCLPVGGHAGMNSFTSLRITLVDVDGNKKGKTLDFLLVDEDGVLHYDGAYNIVTEGKDIKYVSNNTSYDSTSDIVKSYLNSLLDTTKDVGPTRVGLAVLTSSKLGPVSYGIGSGAIENVNVAKNPIVVKKQQALCEEDCSLTYIYGNVDSPNYALNHLKLQLENDKETVQLIINELLEGSDDKATNQDYLLIEPIFIWIRSALLYDNNIKFYGGTETVVNEKGEKEEQKIYYDYCLRGDM